MEGTTHALTGACAGMATAPLFGIDTTATASLFAATCSGFAVWPDLDHPSASASRLLGPLTQLLSHGVQWLSRTTYLATRSPADRRTSGTHRHLTHTALGVIIVGLLCALSTMLGPLWVTAVWLVFGILLALDRLGWLASVGLIPTLLMWAHGGGLETTAVQMLEDTRSWLGIAVVLGGWVHILGDMVTITGCPVAWPIPIGGQRWKEITTPRFLSFAVGKGFEQWVVMPLAMLALVCVTPGLLPLVLRGAAALTQLVL